MYLYILRLGEPPVAQTKRKTTTKKKTTAKGRNPAPRKKTKTVYKMTQKERARRNQNWAFALFVLALFVLCAMLGAHAPVLDVLNTLVRKGVGVGIFVLPISLVFAGVLLIQCKGRPIKGRVICTLIFPLCVAACAHALVGNGDASVPLSVMAEQGNALSGGGVLAGYFAALCVTALSRVVTVILFLVVSFFVLLNACNITLVSIWEKLREMWETRPQGVEYDDLPEEPKEEPVKKRRISIDMPLDGEERPKAEMKLRKRAVKTPAELLAEEQANADCAAWLVSEETPVVVEEPKEEPKTEAKEDKPAIVPELPGEPIEVEEGAYNYPPLSLLKPAANSAKQNDAELRINAQRLVETIKSFGIEVHLLNIVSGPAVTRYEIQLDPGVKFSRLTGLADDIALSLGASGVFIAPIPDKLAIGIEVPNKDVQVVSLQEVIGSTAFESAKSNVAFAMGRDITGNCIVGDIAKLPHLLIAGTTGSGKSVCMNSLIMSILYKSTPEEVRLIMVDPKVVELTIYNGIPHLLVPVVTDPRKASGALQWAVLEMMKRYKLFADSGVRDIKGYNQHVERAGEGEKLPQIVIVIDELADLMVVARKEVEDSIMRLTQMARAAGMHLVIATQRPSVDVITGVIKSNIPSRIAFAVASKIESNIILGSAGAEKLIGRGDMLYAPIGSTKPTRIQGCFVSDEEVEAVVEYVKRGKEAEYSEEVIQQIEQQANKATAAEAGDAVEGGDEDEMLGAAIDVVLESGQASVSLLQRRLKLGYSRAARIVDQMEERGIVGPFEGAKPRKILISKEQWQEIKMRRENLL